MNSGQLRKYDRFRSRILRNQRDVIIYLPPGYDEQADRRFPVLYLHDGQNLFDSATAFNGQDWHMGQTADYAISAGLVQPLIIVGIYNTGKGRIREYTPTKVPRLGGGRADGYAKFLIQEVKPFVDRDYRTQPDTSNTGIGGSSLGGLVSIYVGLKFAHIFGKIAALSPSVSQLRQNPKTCQPPNACANRQTPINNGDFSQKYFAHVFHATHYN